MEDNYIRPKWIHTFTDVVRPGGVALMFFFITILPLIFAFLELGIAGVGTKLAGVLAGYFKAIPDVYYTTLQVLFLGFVAGKSAEKIMDGVQAGKAITRADTATVNIDQRGLDNGSDAKG